MDSVAIVTGASSGIGKATALRLARNFSKVTLVGLDGEKLSAVGAEVKAIGAEPLVIEADLRTPTAADSVVKNSLGKSGRIDALLNVAAQSRGSTSSK